MKTKEQLGFKKLNIHTNLSKRAGRGGGALNEMWLVRTENRGTLDKGFEPGMHNELLRFSNNINLLLQMGKGFQCHFRFISFIFLFIVYEYTVSLCIQTHQRGALDPTASYHIVAGN